MRKEGLRKEGSGRRSGVGGGVEAADHVYYTQYYTYTVGQKNYDDISIPFLIDTISLDIRYCT